MDKFIEIRFRDPCTDSLAVGFQDFLLDKFFVYGSNAGRTDIIFMLLCVAADRVLKKPNGEIELNITPDKLNHTKSQTSHCVYRKFLEKVLVLTSKHLLFPESDIIKKSSDSFFIVNLKLSYYCAN